VGIPLVEEHQHNLVVVVDTVEVGRLRSHALLLVLLHRLAPEVDTRIPCLEVEPQLEEAILPSTVTVVEVVASADIIIEYLSFLYYCGCRLM